jgi:AbrB family looped-hinge helix DNA binding protein
MYTTHVSSKYQVVIPKEVRDRSGIAEGQALRAYPVDGGVLLLKEKSWPDGYIGSMKDLWEGVDVKSYMEDIRAW